MALVLQKTSMWWLIIVMIFSPLRGLQFNQIAPKYVQNTEIKTHKFPSYGFNRLSCIGFWFTGFQQNSSCAREFYDETHFQLIIPDEVFLA